MLPPCPLLPSFLASSPSKPVAVGEGLHLQGAIWKRFELLERIYFIVSLLVAHRYIERKRYQNKRKVTCFFRLVHAWEFGFN